MNNIYDFNDDFNNRGKEDHTAQVVGTIIGSVVLGIVGLITGSHFGICGGGNACNGSGPFAAAGMLIGGSLGNTAGYQIDQKKKKREDNKQS